MRKWVLAVACAACLHAHAQEDKRNVMLNAEEASVPREINIGLPDSGQGAVVYVDGHKHAWGLPRGYFHWAGGNSYEPVNVMGLMEAVISTGEFGMPVDSRTRLGGDALSGVFSGGTSSNGLIRIDSWLGGPLSGRWSYSLGAYINYDPTNVPAPSRPYVDQKQIWQASLTGRWRESSLSLIYRYSRCDDRIDGGYSVAPFVYEGDGSIGRIAGFRLGHDCYMPRDEHVSWMDVKTGKMRSGKMNNMDRRILHDVTVKYDHSMGAGWDYTLSAHLMHMQPSQSVKVTLVGIDYVDYSRGYGYEDGSLFDGYLQNRLATVYDATETDVEVIAKISGAIGRHKVRAGFSGVYASQYEAGSSFQFAHTVEPSPVRLYFGGASTWSFNRSSTYLDAERVSGAFYLFDDYIAAPRLILRSGIRLKPLYIDLYNASRLDGETLNTRVDGYNIADPSMSALHEFRRTGMDYVVSENVSYTASAHMTLMAEGFYSMTEKATTYYKNPVLPSLNPIGNALARAAMSYVNPWLDVSLSVSYITSWHNAALVSVTRQIGGVSETIPWTAQYGIGTLGAAMDATLHFGAYTLHLNGTWQDPRYRNYSNVFVFSDGSESVLDYTGNRVTGISSTMLEIDPSYRWKRYRVWGSLRYYSRQYASRTNYAYFKGHAETFAGFELDINTRNRLSVNMVNLLGQSGAKGSIDIADTVESPSALEGYIMSGSYIRPFTVEAAYTYRF